MLTKVFSAKKRKHRDRSVLSFWMPWRCVPELKVSDVPSLWGCVPYTIRPKSKIFCICFSRRGSSRILIKIVYNPGTGFLQVQYILLYIKGTVSLIGFGFFSQVCLVLSLTRGLSWFSNFYRLQWFYNAKSVFLAVNASLHLLNNVNCVFFVSLH